jgi:hypothetical protein
MGRCCLAGVGLSTTDALLQSPSEAEAHSIDRRFESQMTNVNGVAFVG